jgi:2-oxoglutarate ferredoxin oxidoreductase subunit alpha
MQRLLRKFETAKELVPEPELHVGTHASQFGVIFYGSTAPAMDEALDALEVRGLDVDGLRIRAFPFSDAVTDFIAEHDQIFVIEQNRDAQLRMLLSNECGIDPTKLMAVLHYDGTPITARFIIREISEEIAALNDAPLRSTGTK